MFNLNDLKPGQKVLDKIDGMIMEIYEKNGVKYLASSKSLWPVYQFDSNDFTLYEGNLKAGENCWKRK